MVHALTPVLQATHAPLFNPYPVIHKVAVTLLVHYAALAPQALQVLLAKY